MPEESNITVEECLQIITAMEDAGRLRAQDRATINAQFNGGRPYSEEEVEEHQIQVNANFLEGYRVAIDGNTQVNGALLNKDKFFNVRCVKGPPEKRDDWGRKFTTNIHKILKRGKSGKKHLFLMKNRNASLVLHGIGAMFWPNNYCWMPRFIPLDDLLIPTDSPQEMSEELCHFGVTVYLTPYELFKMISGKHVDPGWNVPYVKQILASVPNSTIQYTPDVWNKPEEFESQWKQHSLFMNSDAVKRIKVTFFFYQDEEDGGWYRKVVLRESDGARVAPNDKFMYESKKQFASSIDEILHVQFGDGNVVPPFKFHSVRGLGMMLYGVVELMNRLRCQFIQHTFESLMAILRINNPTDRERPKLLQLHPYAVLEDGVSFIPQQERHMVDPQLVNQAFSGQRQLMAETSASYVQDIDSGTAKEQTAHESQIKLQSANKIIGGMLSNIYLQEHFYYEEVIRRFQSKTSGEEEIEAFQKDCKSDAIPDAILYDHEAWEVDVEKVFGMGDQTLAVQQVMALMNIIAQLDPSAQMVVRRKYVEAITQNADLANLLVPEQQVLNSKGRQEAENLFPLLMRGIPAGLREGIEHKDYVSTMLNAMAMTVDAISQGDNIGTKEDVIGLQNVANDIQQHANIMAQDQANKEFVTAVGKALGKMMNDVKGFAQRQQEQMMQAQQAQQDSEQMAAQAKVQALIQTAQAKVQVMMQQAQAKMQLEMQKHQQQMAMDAEAHQMNMRLRMEESTQDLGLDRMKEEREAEMEFAKLQKELELAGIEAAAEISLDSTAAKAEVENDALKTEAEIEAIEEKAKAEAEAAKKRKPPGDSKLPE